MSPSSASWILGHGLQTAVSFRSQGVLKHFESVVNILKLSDILTQLDDFHLLQGMFSLEVAEEAVLSPISYIPL